MKLPFFSKSSDEGKIFFGLFLKEKGGIGLVLKSEDVKIVLLDQEKFNYTDGWEHLAEDIDNLIVKLEQRTKVKLLDTIFFVYSHFIDEKTKEIKKPYLQKIKDLVKSLNLKALGYIECYEAIIHYLGKREELPLTAVILELDKSELSVFVYKRGKLVYTKTLAHTDNLVDDLLSCFTEIKGKFLLPSRIILYNSKDLDNESTAIVTYRWSEEFFVQLPRVEIVKEHELIQGLLDVFAEQFQHKAKQAEFTDRQSPSEIMGFVIGGDVAVTKKDVPSKSAPSSFPQVSIVPLLTNIKLIFYKIKAFIFSLGKKWTISLGIILIVSSLFLNEYFLHKADLTVFLPAIKMQKDVLLNSDELSIQSVSNLVELKDSKNTTGKKDIGEAAKGTVTLHNFDDKEKTFSKGSVLDTAGIKFNLDSEIKVASASVVTINGGLVKQPGKAKVTVIAQAIGPQGNLSANKQFKIDDFSSVLYFAVNESQFSGGTKREIKTTSKKDQEDLEKSILEAAKKQKPETVKKEDTDKKFLNPLTETSVVEAKFDKEIGEESDKLNIQAKVNTTKYFYSEKALIDYLVKLLKNDLEKGYNLENKQISYTLKNTVKKNDKITLDLSIKAKALKEISKQEILKQIKGKSTESVNAILKEKFKVEGSKQDIEPDIPLLEGFFPLFDKNISIVFSSL